MCRILCYSSYSPAWSSPAMPQRVTSDMEEGLKSWAGCSPLSPQAVPRQCSRTGQMPCEGNTASRKKKTVITYSSSAWQSSSKVLQKFRSFPNQLPTDGSTALVIRHLNTVWYLNTSHVGQNPSNMGVLRT